jgi:tetratricopeptide (TPR) repeat protein
VALTHKYIATAHHNLGEEETALEGYRRSEAIERDLVAADPTNALYKRDLSHSYGGIGESLFVLGRIEEGAESYRKAILLRQELADSDPTNAAIRNALARGYLGLGYQHAQRGDPRAALESLGQAARILEALTTSDPENADKVLSLAECFAQAGVAHKRIAEGVPPGLRAAAPEWQRARENLLKARDMLGVLEKKGKLTPSGKEELALVNGYLGPVSAALDPRSRKGLAPK